MVSLTMFLNLNNSFPILRKITIRYTDPKGKTYEATGVPVRYEMNYPRNRRDFYNGFYTGNHFIGLALDKISEK